MGVGIQARRKGKAREMEKFDLTDLQVLVDVAQLSGQDQDWCPRNEPQEDAARRLRDAGLLDGHFGLYQGTAAGNALVMTWLDLLVGKAVRSDV
ncbi:hypothetical protein UFOVP650_30 [uncultured Caudovirales phage]|uniref:Uncharacterized protein n=1 Tax=uncultured Caudovirales phage TaxID=2100421 RepID=A0A6J5NH65_9CAUD|nr:hypothetical protein UFOVP650_30 [uncultured Caudovirales phage]